MSLNRPRHICNIVSTRFDFLPARWRERLDDEDTAASVAVDAEKGFDDVVGVVVDKDAFQTVVA